MRVELPNGILYFLLAAIYLSAVFGILTSVPRKDLAQQYKTVVSPDTRIGTLPGDLPVVRVDYGKYRPNVNDGDSNDDNSEDINRIRRQCLSSGYRLGSEDTWADCPAVCNTPNVMYQYYTNESNVYVGRLQMRAGAYCVPTQAANCNLRTSLIIYAYEGWTCLPQISGLTGEGGNTIALCDGRIWDRGTGTVYEKEIPFDLVFKDFTHDKLSDGDYRFKCVQNVRDRQNNLLLTSPFNRLQFTENFCLKNIPNAAYQDVIWDTGVGCPCVASSNGQWEKDYTDNGTCTACLLKVDPISLYTYFARRKCYSTVDNLTTLEKLLSDDMFIAPCGTTYLDVEEGGRPRCTTAGLQAFTVSAPSAGTLLRRFA